MGKDMSKTELNDGKQNKSTICSCSALKDYSGINEIQPPLSCQFLSQYLVLHFHKSTGLNINTAEAAIHQFSDRWVKFQSKRSCKFYNATTAMFSLDTNCL